MHQIKLCNQRKPLISVHGCGCINEFSFSGRNLLLLLRDAIASFLPSGYLFAGTLIRDELVQSTDIRPSTTHHNVLISTIARKHSLKLATLQQFPMPHPNAYAIL